MRWLLTESGAPLAREDGGLILTEHSYAQAAYGVTRTLATGTVTPAVVVVPELPAPGVAWGRQRRRTRPPMVPASMSVGSAAGVYGVTAAHAEGRLVFAGAARAELPATVTRASGRVVSTAIALQNELILTLTGALDPAAVLAALVHRTRGRQLTVDESNAVLLLLDELEESQAA